MDDGLPLQNKDQREFNWKLFFIGAILIVCAAGYLFFLLMSDSVSKEPVRENVFADISGKLYLSLALAGSSHLDLYTLDIGDSFIQKYTRDGLVSYAETVSNAGGTAAFFASPFDIGDNMQGGAPALTSFFLYTQNLHTGALERRTNEAYDTARFAPQWSPQDDRIAFVSRLNASPPFDRRFEPDNWMIHVYDLNSHAVTDIGVGTNPMWSLDGQRLLALRNDGLYSYDVTDKSLRKFFSSTSTTTIGMKLSMSKNIPRLLAWTTKGSLRIWQLGKNENGFITLASSTLIRKIETGSEIPSWPVFSPDNKFVAVKLINVIDRNTRSSRLVIFNIETGEQVGSYDLEGFNPDLALISDWE
jgi:Tol biopolymer transport system component